MNVMDSNFEECTHQLLDEDLSDESAAEDEFEVQDENTDSEQDDGETSNNRETNNDVIIEAQGTGDDAVEIAENDHSSSEESGDTQPQSYYGKPQGKNRYRFKWSSEEPTRRGRPLAHNLLILPQLRGNVKALGVEATPCDIWMTIFTPEIMNQILEHTNAKLLQIKPKYADQNIPELKKCFLKCEHL